MRLLYPSDPFQKKNPDEKYAQEFLAAQGAGIPCSLYSAEDFESGIFKPRPPFLAGEELAYRGWMLTPAEFGQLKSAVENKDAHFLTSVEQYRRCHYLPEWYAICEEFTPKTVFLEKGDDYAAELSPLGWRAFFVKDYVKSLTTLRGSVAKTIDEIPEIIALIEKYRGQIEGGICIREYEEFRPETEERFFAFHGRAYSRNGVVPDVVNEIASRIDSPFFSIDIVERADGVPRLIELGDGQVSDAKKWETEHFVRIFLD
jgi:hypothetical protein